MLAIRLRRTGAKKDAHYRVVVTERSAGRDGRFLEILGHYHPRRDPMEVTFDFVRTEVWLGKGAQMSDTVRSLYNKAQNGTLPTEEAAADPPPPAEEVLETAAAAEAAEDGAAEVDAGADGSAADEVSDAKSDGEEE
jgi:small subunit ribosomal protein S16